MQDDQERVLRLENECHALRVLYAMHLRYDNAALQERVSPALTDFALALTAATTLKQWENVLTYKLSELAIPSIVVALSPYLTTQLAPATISTVIPALPADRAKLLPYKVREPKLLPKALFSSAKRFSVTLLVLSHNAQYLGYAYVYNGAENPTVYDDVQKLLSQTLYALYAKENKVKAHALVITDREKLADTVPLAPRKDAATHGRIQAQDIMHYLIDHLDEMLTLEKMADDFHLSKSHLARRIRALTGYSMQTLHERLKIEQAKDLIKSGTLRMNDISARLGYTNPNYFSNVFKKVTGLSPLNWAAKIGD